MPYILSETSNREPNSSTFV